MAVKATGKKEPAREHKHTFEQSLKRLEVIVETLEQGGVSLDQVMAMYEEGVELSKECLEQLNKAEVTLKRLTKNVKGSFELFEEKMNE